MVLSNIGKGDACAECCDGIVLLGLCGQQPYVHLPDITGDNT